MPDVLVRPDSIRRHADALTGRFVWATERRQSVALLSFRVLWEGPTVEAR
jgi:hypothetical protein